MTFPCRILRRGAFLAILNLACPLAAQVNQEVLSNRDGPYNLLTHPAPPDFHRPLAPDPHPYTVEPGRLQMEISPLSFARDRHNPDRDNLRTRTWQVPVALKMGLLHDMDFRLGLDAFVWQRLDDADAATTTRDQGMGDLTLGSKINLWGNDAEQDHALAVVAFLQLPTARHDLGSSKVQGGLMFPWAWRFADGWEAQWTARLAAIRDSGDARYEMEFGSLITVSRDLVDRLSAFTEFEAIIDTENGRRWAAAVNAGLTWEVTPDMVLEGSVGFGLTRAADDFTAAITIVQRF